MKWERVGRGSEAVVYRGFPKTVPMGDRKVATLEYPVAKRYCNSPEEMYSKNLVLRILDAQFVDDEIYSQHHIPLPLGWDEESHYYAYVQGREGFWWKMKTPESVPHGIPIELEEWSIFVSTFYRYAKMNHDVSDVDDGNIAKNIIHEDFDYSKVLQGEPINKNWKRIDFGPQSCPWNPDAILEDLEDLATEKRASHIEYLIG